MKHRNIKVYHHRDVRLGFPEGKKTKFTPTDPFPETSTKTVALPSGQVSISTQYSSLYIQSFPCKIIYIA